MKRSGPDSLNSWMIAFACGFINMMMYGMARLSGILFVASITRFNVSRKQASFPYTFDNFMRNTSGPLVGFLGHRYGVRAVTTFGCLLGAIGAGACYFAESITTVTLLWGAIFGLGFGLGSILLPVSINQYFDKHRATASGISYSGACVGSFLLPPIVEICLNTYGLSGTYLFLSGFILNCVPAALLLKKPNFDIKYNSYEYEESEKQSIISGVKVKLYTVEKDCPKSQAILKDNTGVETIPKIEDKDTDAYNSVLTYDERMKRLSTQTLLSDYSIRMSVSEPLNVEQIIENSKGRRTVDPKVHEAESLSLSSQNTDQNESSDKDEVFEKDFRSSSVQYEKPAAQLTKSRALSSEHIAFYKENSNFPKPEAYLNYGYQDHADEVNLRNELDVRTNSAKTDVPKEAGTHSNNISDSSANYSYQRNSDNFKFLPDEFKNPANMQKNCTKSIEWSDASNVQARHEVLSSPQKSIPANRKQSSLGSFSVIFDPMFILITITNAIYCFTFVCMITIIVDFARDLDIGASNEKYVLMSMSVGDLIGRLSMGWITDRGYLTTTEFAAVCFASQGVTTAAIVWSDGFLTFIILITLYGLSEAGLIIIYPIIVAKYIDQDKQTVAIPSSNFLSGPLCLTVAPIIGYCRDEIGSYDYIFYGVAILSAACCIAMLLAPLVAKCQSRSRCQTK